MEPQNGSLATLIDPVPAATFFQDYWTQKALWVSASDCDRFRHLFGWQTVNYLLNFHNLRYPEDVRLARDGETLTPSAADGWLSHLQNGATLILNAVHERIPSLSTLAARLQYELGHPVQVNAYCTPPEQQGFNCHYDTHDVAVLQLDGEKEWWVFSETTLFPTADTRQPHELPPDEAPYLKVVLKPGDLLYVPRGHWHYAVSCDRPAWENVPGRPSLHLTVGFSGRTGLDWLAWMQRQLRESPQWRQTLPTLHPEDPQALSQHLAELAAALAEYAGDADCWRGYRDAWNADERAVMPEAIAAPWSLPQQLGNDLFEAGLETQFRRSPFQHLAIATLPDGSLQVKIGSTQLVWQTGEHDLLRWLFDRDAFSLLELAEVAPDLDWEAVVAPLLTRLVREGVLFVVSPRD